MKRFDYLAPKNLREAFEMMSDHPKAIPLAGGTDLLVQMKEGRCPAQALLSLKRIPEVHQFACNGKLVFGSAVTVGQIAADQRVRQAYTALAIGAGLIGSVQIRNMATVEATCAMPLPLPTLRRPCWCWARRP